MRHADGSALAGTLFLEDGTRFDSRGFGATGRRVGEVVFTTGMVGYPESLTDPSFRGQILTFTYPLLGNYGVPPPDARDEHGLPKFLESTGIQVRAAIVRGLTRANHWQSVKSLDSWLAEEGVPGLVGVDTRRLTEHLRSHGVVRGVVDVAAGDARPSDEELRNALKAAPTYEEEAFVPQVAVRSPVEYGAKPAPLVGVIDCGIKTSILRNLLDRNLSVLRLPYDQEVPDRWEGRKVRGILIGNGPGDPDQLE
ncbi:MAG TPA: carbamoyl-phosphate synthase domain-containing protein, partial [Thermoplasmata archaeon]|nr:carbamoyl-phosphate synthase domain-containing protein [Thermoplasmata archaeon]